MKTMVEMIQDQTREETICEMSQVSLQKDQVAADMLAKGYPIEAASDISKLDIEKVKEIAASMGK